MTAPPAAAPNAHAAHAANPPQPAISANPPPPADSAHRPPPAHAPRLPPALALAWALAAVALAAALLLWQKVSGMQQQLARQSADSAARAAEAHLMARQASEQVREAGTRLAAQQLLLSDMAAYRAQLEALVQGMSRARDENLAVDLESALRVAQEQAQLTGSVQPLLAALRTVERRSARAGDPRLNAVRQAVAADMERVRDAAVADTAGLLVRIDQLLRQTDALPTLADAAGARTAAAPGAPGAPDGDAPASGWRRWWHAALDEARGLVRITRIDRPEAALASPQQLDFVRQHIKLHLQGARLALLARQYEAARADLSAAAALLAQWFDPAARATQAAARALQDIKAQIRTAEIPLADETLAALGQVAALPPPASPADTAAEEAPPAASAPTAAPAAPRR